MNHLLDSKDFQLLVALYGNARQSYASLGRRVSLSAPTVRDRLNHLKKNGILQGFMLSIDSSVFDRDDLLLFFHGNFSRKTVLTAFAAPDVSWVAWKVDGRIHMRLWTKNEREAIDNLTKILGVRPSKRALKPRKRCAPVSITELSIMDALVDDPRAPFGEILKTSGLSPKTVRKHLNLLLETKTIFIDPLLGVLRDSSELVYPLVVAGRVSMDQVRRIMGDAAQIHHTLEPPMKHVLCRASSLADVITKTRVLENLQGVESVTISLDREVLVSTDLRHSLIREEIMKKLEKNRMSYPAPIEVQNKG
ncbi:MAG TPA: winged helix-turn-helix transcriptional regulator [Nitrososphaera sp.]|nr:winged helix-turn-helix transcriptional regulator [Nitrososphaera sp.]